MLVRWDKELPRLNLLHLPGIQMFGFLALPNLSHQTHLTVDTLTAKWRIACEDQAEH